MATTADQPLRDAPFPGMQKGQYADELDVRPSLEGEG